MTNELFPLAPGGIGRLVYNFIEDNAASAERAVDLHLLFLGDDALVARAAEETAGKATVHGLSDRNMDRLLDGAGVEPGWRAGDLRRSHESLAIYLWIQASARRGIAFDVVEFPDIHAWGLHSISAKRAGYAFDATELAVRLHSSNAILSYFEPHQHHPGLGWLYCYDAERFCIERADRVVAHLPTIRDFNARFFDLEPGWSSRVTVQRPPVLLTDFERAPQADPATFPRGLQAAFEAEAPLFVFSQRLQPFKRADLFIDGAIAACRAEGSASGGVFLVLSYGWDRRYIGGLKARIPADLTDRIFFWEEAPAATRAAVLDRAVVVFPSSYESLCLAAIECGQRGQPMILNGACAGFSENPWLAGAGELFDGTGIDLARVMTEQAKARPERRARAARSWSHDPPYWVEPAPARGPRPARSDVTLDVLVWTGRSSATDRRSVEAALSVASPSVRVHVVPAFARDPLRSWLRGLHAAGTIQLVHAEDMSLPEQLLTAIAGISGFAMLVPSGYCVRPEFLRAALEAVSQDEQVKMVSGLLAVGVPTAEAQHLVPRASCSLASCYLQHEPLAAAVFRSAVVAEALRSAHGSPNALRDAHAAVVDAPGYALELPIASADVAASEEAGPERGPVFRSGLMRAVGSRHPYRMALTP